MRSLIIILLAVVGMSCKTSTLATQEGKSKRQVAYFQSDFKNFAWGYQHYGWIIDGEGNAKYYKLPDETFNFFIDSAYVTEEDLLANLSQADSTVFSVPIAELNQKIEELRKIDHSDLSEPTQMAYDMGNTQKYGYVWEEDKQMYRRVFLLHKGDQYQRNNQAVEILNWLASYSNR